MMKKIFFLLTGLMLIAMAVMPAQAFTLNSITINLDRNGDAQIGLQYELSFVEQSAVFLRIADPTAELQKAFQSGSTTPVTVTGATSSSAQIRVPSFASVTTTGGTTVMTTPTLSFERAQAVLNSYWFAPLISPDFSPGVTTVTFPDGKKEYFYERISVPVLTHTIS